MTKKFYISPFSMGIIDFLLLNVSFFGMNYWKRETFALSPLDAKLLIAFYGIWLFVSLFTKKFRFDFGKRYWALLRLYARSTIYMLYCVALMVVIMGLQGFRDCRFSGRAAFFLLGR